MSDPEDTTPANPETVPDPEDTESTDVVRQQFEIFYTSLCTLDVEIPKHGFSKFASEKTRFLSRRLLSTVATLKEKICEGPLSVTLWSVEKFFEENSYLVKTLSSDEDLFREALEEDDEGFNSLNEKFKKAIGEQKEFFARFKTE